MGMWEETCVISGAPILRGDHVLIFEPVAGHEDLFLDAQLFIAQYIAYIAEGTYDGYGSIEGIYPGKSANPRRTMLVHSPVLSSIDHWLAHYPERAQQIQQWYTSAYNLYMVGHGEKTPSFSLEIFLLLGKVLSFANAIRRPLLVNSQFKGRQGISPEERDAQMIASEDFFQLTRIMFHKLNPELHPTKRNS